MNTWSKFTIAALLALDLFLAYRFVFSPHGIMAYFEVQDAYRSMLMRVEEIEQKNVDLSRQIRLMRDNEMYLESVVRREMNYVRPGEVLYLVPDRTRKLPEHE
ncbi:MAG: septum formation initiator family protein [Deltaproteobacteria bacterium]|nr:septum formation initiator family protein [Deltaproteobacteria bacterium]